MSYSNLQLSTKRTARYCNFNASQDLFVSATEDGFAVFKTDPFKMTAKRVIPGGVIMVELLGRSNYVVFVSALQPDMLQLWDDIKCKVVMQLESPLASAIKAIRLHRNALVCVLVNEVRIYSLSISPTLLHKFQTGDNPEGLVTVSGGQDLLLSFPARKSGYVQFVDVGDLQVLEEGQIQMPPKIVIVCAHSSSLVCIAMSFDGSLVATASQTGTLVRVWQTKNGRQICELRRGVDKVHVQSIAFSASRSRLAVVSDKATVHIFNLPTEGSTALLGNKASLFSSLAAVGVASRYFGSTWSVAQARVVEDAAGSQSNGDVSLQFKIAWVQERVFVVLDDSGGLRKFVVPDASKTKSGGSSCQLENYRRWLPSD